MATSSEQARILSPDSYLTYPHANGFISDDAVVVVRRTALPTLAAVDLATGRTSDLFRVGELPERVLFFDLDRRGRHLTFTNRGQLFLVDLKGDVRPRAVFRVDAGSELYDLTSISADGSQVLVIVTTGQRRDVVRVDLSTGATKTLFSKDWYVGHAHFCPADERWIGFCHEGPTWTIPDRVWAWHETLAPDGRCVFDQRAMVDPSTRVPDVPEPARHIDYLYVGHEKWLASEVGFLVVAYGDSLFDPRGLYVGYPDGRPSRLISKGQRDLHGDLSADRRHAVVDTSGPHDRAGRGWHEADRISDVLLIDSATGNRKFLARTGVSVHPHHPHPVFSPGDRYVLFNHTVFDGSASSVDVAAVDVRGAV